MPIMPNEWAFDGEISPPIKFKINAGITICKKPEITVSTEIASIISRKYFIFKPL
jgi:hypothetical protein